VGEGDRDRGERKAVSPRKDAVEPGRILWDGLASASCESSRAPSSESPVEGGGG
jgi:hypothetical protein